MNGVGDERGRSLGVETAPTATLQTSPKVSAPFPEATDAKDHSDETKNVPHTHSSRRSSLEAATQVHSFRSKHGIKSSQALPFSWP